jgi:NAD(P)H-hydrate epimerase
MILEGQKIATANEMARVEKLAYSQGHSDAQFMDNAADAIAEILEAYIEKYGLEKHVLLLTGKGNNAGDAFTAGLRLLENKFSVAAFPLYPREACSPLCQQRYEQFEKAGGKIHPVGTFTFGSKGVILDGIVGTGFQGKAEGILKSAIIQANQSKLPILAIDIPSGVNGNTGEVGSVAINAAQTIYLGLPKIGFFIGNGWDHVGELVQADFGLPAKFTDQAQAEAYLLNEQNLFLPPIKRSRHKYEAGYVLGVAGSKAMGGAALLSSLAALRSGAGIVRLFHAPDMHESAFPLELIKEVCDQDRILEECKRAASLFIGPGLGRTKEVKKILKQLMPQLNLPAVCDADALFFLDECDLPKNCILTPHRREMERLLSGQPVSLSQCQAYAEQKNATIVLKGGPSFVFHPRTRPLVVARGDPGMATAGTGDVLTGVIAAMAAQKCDLRTAAALGTYLHGVAGEMAALDKTSYSMIASDVIDSLPHAIARLIPL